MPRRSIQPKPEIGLVDPPEKKMQDLSNVNELLSIRKEEYLKIQHDLVLIQAKIQSEKAVWERERKRQQTEIEIESGTKNDAYNESMKTVSKLHRVAQEAVDKANVYEHEWKERTLQLNEREQLLGNLSKERIEISRLRHEAELKIADASERLSHALTVQNDASDVMSKASKALVECEARNKIMNDEWNKLNKWQEDLVLHQRNYDLLKVEVDKQLEELTKKEVTSVEEESHV